MRPVIVDFVSNINNKRSMVSFYVDLTTTPEERRIGLSGQPVVHRGMLFDEFVEPRKDIRYTMRSMLAPITMVFISDSGKVIWVENVHPGPSIVYTGRDLLRWVLEMPYESVQKAKISAFNSTLTSIEDVGSRTQLWKKP
jgi:uncharacterized membrane protein (UPF0127 family)